MWLPRPVYEAKPYAAIVAGLACFAVSYFVANSPRGLLFVAGGAFVTYGLMLWMKRRDYRSTQSDYDPRAIDE
jgi:Na+-transporting NADH:ubiquinone oxidoreductase subunit NqrD